MKDRFDPGTIVAHKNRTEWGPGKVVARDGGDLQVYFRDFLSTVPEGKVKKFAADGGFLLVAANQSDPDLDRLPPFVNGRFKRAKTSLSLEAARKRFLAQFPRGFADPGYWKMERKYKWAAHLRYRKYLADDARTWIRDGLADRLRTALLEVYWPTSEDEHPLNLMNPQFEWPAFKDSLESDAPLIGYIDAALEFARQPAPDEAAFDRYAESLALLPTRKGGVKVEKWTVMTWLPFVANPTHHIFLKPQMTQEFASILPFELQYRTHLNHTTYMRLQEMAQRLKSKVSDLEMNPEARDLDMIDVHSFMWIVVEYGQ